MRNPLIIILLIMFLPLTIFSQNLAKIDAKRGFREFILGTSIKNYKNLIPIEEDIKDEEIHIVKGNLKPLGENKVFEIKIYSYKGTIMHIALKIDATFEEYSPLMTENYGKPRNNSSKLAGMNYSWKGNKTWITLSQAHYGPYPNNECIEIMYSNSTLPVKKKAQVKSEI